MVSPNPNDPQPMKYTMLGRIRSRLRKSFPNYLVTVDWKYLRPHYQSGVLYFVDPVLNLGEVGYAFSENQKEQVRGLAEIRRHCENW